MAILLKHKAFRIVIKRKTPCLICIYDKFSATNHKIHESINNLCNDFPFVLCYKITNQDYEEYHLNKTTYGPNNLIRFEDEKIISVVDGKNYSEMYRLFWQVYIDACANNFEGYLNILYAEKRLPSQNRLIYDKNEISFLEEIEGGILSKFFDYEKKKYVKPDFKHHICSTRPISRKDYYNTPINPSLKNQKRKNKLHSNTTHLYNKNAPYIEPIMKISLNADGQKKIKGRLYSLN